MKKEKKKLLVNTLPYYWRRDVDAEREIERNISCTVILSRDVINIKQTFHFKDSRTNEIAFRGIYLVRKCERVKSWSVRLLATGTSPEQLLSSTNHCQNTIFHVRLLSSQLVRFSPLGLRLHFETEFSSRVTEEKRWLFWKYILKMWNKTCIERDQTAFNIKKKKEKNDIRNICILKIRVISIIISIIDFYDINEIGQFRNFQRIWNFLKI